jgi:hypothetical protein
VWRGLQLVVLVATAALPTPVTFRVSIDTGIRLTDVVWTGKTFLYLENTTNTVWATGPNGGPPVRFASMPNEVEETRCAMSSGTHGFSPGDLYCHAPDNTIYRIGPDGSVSAFARLPDRSVSDGALAFDTVGKFGYELVAATGRSGAPEPGGGTVFVVAASGAVQPIGTYAGPGGADGICVLPRTFGNASGAVALTLDAGNQGTIVLMDRRGRTRTIASLPDGLNPIAVVAKRSSHPRSRVQPGLYVTDTASRDVFFAPAVQLAPYVGDLIVGSEVKGLFWIVRPRGRGTQTLLVPTSLPAGQTYNLEGAAYVSG